MSDGIEFKGYSRTPRLRRNVTITEKLDGTNACVIVTEDGEVGAQSRKRLIRVGDDNFGFAAWVEENKDALRTFLGTGYHYGEWWGHGIQRGYGLEKGDRRFSLFNPRYTDQLDDAHAQYELENVEVVPILAQGILSDRLVNEALTDLREFGSRAAEAQNAEGIVVYHEDARQVFKVLLQADHLPKGLAA